MGADAKDPFRQGNSNDQSFVGKDMALHVPEQDWMCPACRTWQGSGIWGAGYIGKGHG